MRSVQRNVNGAEFGFTDGDAFGMSGLVIDPAEFLSHSSERWYQDAMKEAVGMALSFTALCRTWNFLNSPRPIKDYSLFELEQVVVRAKLCIEQEHWDKEDFEVYSPENAIVIAQDEINERRQKEARVKLRAAGKRAGYVYLIRSATGYYKIGRTVDPSNRIKTFGVKLPFEVEYECLIESADMHGLEAELHNHYAKQRVNGEWFQLAPEDVDYIKGLAS